MNETMHNLRFVNNTISPICYAIKMIIMKRVVLSVSKYKKKTYSNDELELDAQKSFQTLNPQPAFDFVSRDKKENIIEKR